jgi:hypothetical protein
MDITTYPTENHYTELYKMFQKIKMDKKKYNGRTNRLGFPEHRGAVFGLVKPRYQSQTQLSRPSRLYPKIYEEINRIGKLIVPFEYKTIQVNHNLVCPKHKDKNNQTRAVLVSFGEYTGGEIVIEGEKYNAYHTPIEFDGSKLEHWNEPIEGNKYSLIFFS